MLDFGAGMEHFRNHSETQTPMLRELSRTFTLLMIPALTKSPSLVATFRPRMSKYTVAVACVFALGAGLRLTAFLHDRSLWLDEAMLARNIDSRSYSELAKPLAYHQGAPLGYLAAVKTFVLIEGVNEYALRAMSLIAALMALGLFTAFARTYFHGFDWVFPCVLFALSPISIYYAGEAKQYSQDLLVSVLLLYIMSKRERMGRFWGVAALGAAGAIGMWFSYAAVFVLGAIGVLLAFEAIRDRNIGQRVATIALAVTWLFSLIVLYQLSLRDLSGDRVLLDYWRDQFIPISLVKALRWGWSEVLESLCRTDGYSARLRRLLESGRFCDRRAVCCGFRIIVCC